MKIIEIQVSVGTTFNHPHEGYCNYRPGVTLRATLDPGENEREAVKILQGKAETLIEEQKAAILRRLGAEEEARNIAHERAWEERRVVNHRDRWLRAASTEECECGHVKGDHFPSDKDRQPALVNEATHFPCQVQGCGCANFGDLPF